YPTILKNSHKHCISLGCYKIHNLKQNKPVTLFVHDLHLLAAQNYVKIILQINLGIIPRRGRRYQWY
ncbi:MAG: hypothetical protein K2M82_00105, partial [Lachnospiraceae bacterium]|nr:hypothetical protein [Lachnospiraceae bacterium]